MSGTTASNCTSGRKSYSILKDVFDTKCMLRKRCGRGHERASRDDMNAEATRDQVVIGASCVLYEFCKGALWVERAASSPPCDMRHILESFLSRKASSL